MDATGEAKARDQKQKRGSVLLQQLNVEEGGGGAAPTGAAKAASPPKGRRQSTAQMLANTPKKATPKRPSFVDSSEPSGETPRLTSAPPCLPPRASPLGPPDGDSRR